MDFLSSDEKWRVERALELVNAYASGYIANAGLHGGINESTLLDLFRNSYNFVLKVEVERGKG